MELKSALVQTQAWKCTTERKWRIIDFEMEIVSARSYQDLNAFVEHILN